MIASTAPAAPLILALAATALAKTDLAGCTSFTTTTALGTREPTPTILWYVPDTLEICSLIDCGGGRAPPKSDTPGCPAYTGTEAVAVDFLSTDPAAPPVAGTPSPTEAEGGLTSSPRPTGPAEGDQDQDAVSASEGTSTSTKEASTAASLSTTKTELIVAAGPTPSPPTQGAASTTAEPSPTGAADNLPFAPGVVLLLAAGLAAFVAF